MDYRKIILACAIFLVGCSVHTPKPRIVGEAVSLSSNKKIVLNLKVVNPTTDSVIWVNGGLLLSLDNIVIRECKCKFGVRVNPGDSIVVQIVKPFARLGKWDALLEDNIKEVKVKYYE